jgi:amino-acid N-acetyltransferase
MRRSGFSVDRAFAAAACLRYHRDDHAHDPPRSSMKNPARPPKLAAVALALGERAGLAAALRRAELPAADVDEPGHLFWRFETRDGLPVGFGGLEIHGRTALLRSMMTLPPVRGQGIGRAMVAALEREAAEHKCRAVWLLTTGPTDFFERLGYMVRKRADVPAAIRRTAQFSTLCPASAVVMAKRIG